MTLKVTQRNGSPLAVTTRPVRCDRTELGVRCGYIGYWDRKDAELSHATILNAI